MVTVTGRLAPWVTGEGLGLAEYDAFFWTGHGRNAKIKNMIHAKAKAKKFTIAITPIVLTNP